MPLLDVENSGIALAKLRQDRGITASSVAQRLGFDKSTMSKFEGGTREVKFTEYVAYMEAIGLLPGDYLPRTTGIPQSLQGVVNMLEGRSSSELRRAMNVLSAMFDVPYASTLKSGKRDGYRDEAFGVGQGAVAEGSDATNREAGKGEAKGREEGRHKPRKAR